MTRASPATCCGCCFAASAPRCAGPALPRPARPGSAPSPCCTASAPPESPLPLRRLRRRLFRGRRRQRHLDNALVHAHPGPITIDGRRDGGSYVIRIQDAGVGVALGRKQAGAGGACRSLRRHRARTSAWPHARRVPERPTRAEGRKRRLYCNDTPASRLSHCGEWGRRRTPDPWTGPFLLTFSGAGGRAGRAQPPAPGARRARFGPPLGSASPAFENMLCARRQHAHRP
jgi:hypothetical protein